MRPNFSHPMDVHETTAGRPGPSWLPRRYAQWRTLGPACLLTALLSACAAPGVAPDVEPALGPDAAARAAAGAGPDETFRKGFTQEVLYQLLVAELAGRRGQLPLAVSNYLAAAQSTRDAKIAERATRIAMFAQDEAKGLEAAALWSELAPEAMDARHIYAVLLLRAGRTDEALEQTIALSELAEASSGQGLNTVAELLAREKDKERAVEVMERLVAKRPDDPKALFALAHLMARTGKTDRSLELLHRVIAMEPQNVQAVAYLARTLQDHGDTMQALKSLSKAVEMNPEVASLRMTYARLLVDAKRYEEARDQFAHLAEATPDNADVRYALGLLLLQTNHPEQAREQFEALVALGQRSRAAHYYLGQVAELEKDLDGAIEAYRKVDRGEYYLNAQIRVAALLGEQGKVDEARQHLHGLSRSNRGASVRLYLAEAEMLTGLENLEDAMSVYNLALTEHPQDNDLLYARAMLAAKMDQVKLLERDLRDIISRDPNHADALNALGYTLADKSDRLMEAQELIQRALALKPDDYYILDSMGWVLYRLGKYEEAVDYLKRALAQKDDPEVAAHLGEVLWVMGKKKAAQEVWDTALETTPDDERLLNVIKRFSH